MARSEIRKDPLSDRWVIIAEDRDARPSDFQIVPPKTHEQRCPFCQGHEEDTPPALAEFSANGNGRWQVRVVKNKYPAVEPQHEPLPPQPASTLFRRLPAEGDHEIIIESPEHIESLTQLTVDEIRLALVAYRERLQWHRQQGRWRYAQLFKNVGAFAGASLRHTHSQLVAMPMVPKRVTEELHHAEEYWQQEQRCLFCAMAASELDADQRVVYSDNGFLAFCPFASRFAFETWIVPRAHQSHFCSVDDATVTGLASALLAVLQRIEHCCGGAAYNVVFHTGPFDVSAMDHYHWHVEIIPRITTQAGFEWGSEYWINPVSPEQAADDLRR